MPRLRPAEDRELTPVGHALLNHARAAGAPDHRVVSIYARTPIGEAFFEFWNRLMGETTLPIRLKELVRLRISISKECGYCTSVRSNAAKAEGVDEALIAEMLDYEYSDAFTPQELAALRFADLYRETGGSGADDDAVWADLNAHFSDEQIIELGIFLTLNVGGSGFAKALQLVSWEEACELTPELQAVLARRRAREAAARTAAE